MKKTLLAAVMAVFAMTASAQIYVGGQIGFTSSSVKVYSDGDSKSGTSFKILPEVGYKLNENWAVGLQVGYSQGITSFGTFDVNDLRSLAHTAVGSVLDVLGNSDLTDVKLNSFRVAPYARFTFLKAGNFDFFLEGGVAYTNIKAKNLGNIVRILDEDPTVNALEIGIRPGIIFNVTKNAQVVAKIGNLGYQFAKLNLGSDASDAGVKPSINRFGIDIDGDDMSLGFNYQF